jgi:hypothetical protein
MSNHSFAVPQEIKFKDLADLLVGAFEGGSTYWIDYVELKKPEVIDFVYDETKMYPHYTYPFNKGGAVIVFPEDDDGKSYNLDLDSIRKGLETFCKTKHYADLLAEQTDATTSDVFLQHCLFGKEIYG